MVKNAMKSVFVQSFLILSLVLVNHTLNAAPFVARHGLTSTQYQLIMDKLSKKGYRLVDVSAYTIANTPKFAGIWIKDSNMPWLAKHDLSSKQYQRIFNNYTSQGYRLVDISGYSKDGQARYACIWVKQKGPSWLSRHGMTSFQYQHYFDQYLLKGYRLKHVSGYNVDGKIYYAAIWDKTKSNKWVAKHGLNSQQLQLAFNDYVNKGYRLYQVSGYKGPNDEPNFAAIWIKKKGPKWMARFNLNSQQYQQLFNEEIKKKYTLKNISGYDNKGKSAYTAIWTK
jgi:Polyglycine hydrolase-like, structural repeat